jgi:hypothetical protein
MKLTTRVAVAGAADTASFLAKRRDLFTTSPARAYGSVAFGGLWAALAVKSLVDGDHSDNATLVLAAALAAANGAMLAVHLRNHVTSPRVFAGAALSAVALADTLRRR